MLQRKLVGPFWVAGALLVIASLYALTWRLAGWDMPPAIGDAVLIVVAIGACAASLHAWRSTQDRAWLYLASSCGLWSIGQAIWTYAELVTLSGQLFPSIADAGYLGATAGALVAATQIPRRPGKRAWIIVLDGTVVAVSLVIVSWALLGSSVPTAADPRHVWLAMVYPAADVAIVTALVTSLPTVAARWRAPLVYIVAGFAAFTIADIGFAALSATDAYVTGHPIDLGWVAGFMLIAVGAGRARAASVVGSSDSVTLHDRRPMVLTPYAFVAPAAVAVLWVEVGRGVVEGFFVYLGLVLVSVLAVRNGLTLLESERRAAALEREMTFDALTGLWNRRTVSQHLSRLAASGAPFAVAVIDIDGVKDLNNSLGHQAGDAIIYSVAERIRTSVDPDAAVARIGGDEFAIVLAGSADVADAIRVVVHLLDVLADPVPVEGTVRQITVSAGIAAGHGDGASALDTAEFAMHSAQRQGKNRFEVYEPRMHADARERIELTVDIGRALARDEFVVYYQPAIRLSDGAVVGAEALIRWNHPERGVLRPGDFIPLVEATPHIEQLGQWVLREACRFGAELMGSGLAGEGFRMSVNVSPRQLYSTSFADMVERALADTKIPPRSLVLEITESSFVDIRQAVPTLSALRALGVRLAVDDFGTGYSSLSYLHQLPLDILKIDRSFVAGIDHDVHLRAMTRTILTIAESLGLITVAEGVERPAQLAELRAQGCAAAQGYLWSAPVPDVTFTLLLQTGFLPRREPHGRPLTSVSACPWTHPPIDLSRGGSFAACRPAAGHLCTCPDSRIAGLAGQVGRRLTPPG